MKNSLETKLGIFVVLAIFAAIFIIEMVGGTDIFQRGYHVNAQFDTVQELKVGDSVKMAGVEIGRVEKNRARRRQGRGDHETSSRRRCKKPTARR